MSLTGTETEIVNVIAELKGALVAASADESRE